MFVGRRYVGSTFVPLKQIFPMFTTFFRKETFNSKSLIGVFKNGFGPNP